MCSAFAITTNITSCHVFLGSTDIQLGIKLDGTID